MDSNLKKRITFGADAEFIGATRGKQKKYLFLIVLGAILILFSALFWDLQYKNILEPLKSNIFMALKYVCLAAGLIEVVFSLLQLADTFRVQRNLEQTRVVLYEDKLKLTYFANPQTDHAGRELELYYENINWAEEFPSKDKS